MKKLIGGIALGLVLGGAGVLGAMQIPSVNSALIDNNIVPTVKVENLADENKMASLEAENLVLKSEISSKNTELENTKAQLLEKDTLINEKETKIVSLNEQIASLNSELDTYKELVGNDVNYIELINNLNNELDAKKSELEIATAELTQLRLDKETLTARVSELESELITLEEELANYKSLENIDYLNTACYDGTWYKDGTFEDYFIIDNGTVTHNNNDDSGVINSLNNQMYMFLSSSSQVIKLSTDGNSFIMANGDIYKKFYINTITQTVPNLGLISGTYNNDTTTIVLNADNTLSYTDDKGTYYGAYTVLSEEKNVGGNKVTYNYISVTINIDDTQVFKEFTYTSGSSHLIDSNNISYLKTVALSGTILNLKGRYADSAQYAPGSPSSMSSYPYKVIIKTRTPLTIEPNEYVHLTALVGRNDGSYSNIYFRVNGGTGYLNTGSDNVCYFYNYGNETIVSDVFEFYVGSVSSTMLLCDFISFGGVDCDVISVEKYYNGTSTIYPLGGHLNELLHLNSLFLLDCSTIDEYVESTYSNDDMLFSLSEGIADITIGDTAISGTYDVTAETDGYDIYHSITVSYVATESVDGVDTEVSHTLVLNLKNNNISSSTLDDVSIELIKN